MLEQGDLIYASALASSAVSVWFVFRGFRRRYGVDDQLTRKEHIIRWSVVAAGFCLALFPGSDTEFFRIVRVPGIVIVFGFLAWPNFAHMVGNLVTKTNEDT
jgi:hypothetical protein